jgi:hypothetical protein
MLFDKRLSASPRSAGGPIDATYGANPEYTGKASHHLAYPPAPACSAAYYHHWHAFSHCRMHTEAHMPRLIPFRKII